MSDGFIAVFGIGYLLGVVSTIIVVGGGYVAELIRKFFEMNDMDVLIIGVLYFGGVLIGAIYCIRKWRKGENE